MLIINDDTDEDSAIDDGFTSFISFTPYQDLWIPSHFHDFILLGQVKEVQKEKEAK